jgi:glutamate-1-semialdehyde 2,1-aminomutase
MDQWRQSRELWERAKHVLPGGVSSNVRLLAQPHPLFFERAEGALMVDVDGNTYIDYMMSQGPMILGHSPAAVIKAVNTAMRQGQLYAGQHRLEIEVAETLARLIPCAEMSRFGLTGSEIVQAAMRLTRAVTGRTKILRFEGHYHGWFDNVLLNVAPPVETATSRRPLTSRSTAGQVESVMDDYVVLPWNDLQLVKDLFAEMGPTIAAIITEPMMCNTGAIPPEPEYLAGLRRLCDEYGVVFILDEVITGFRLGLHGAQGRFDITPDLAIFAKAMAAGFANSALVGRREYMERFAQDVNHSGTFNSNVISMAASAAALAELERDEGAVYRHMEQIGQSLMDGIQEIAVRQGVPLLVQGFPTAFHLSFTELPALKSYRDYALHCDKERYNRFVLAMLQRGVRLVGRGIWYISAAHTGDHVAQTLEAVEAALQET